MIVAIMTEMMCCWFTTAAAAAKTGFMGGQPHLNKTIFFFTGMRTYRLFAGFFFIHLPAVKKIFLFTSGG